METTLGEAAARGFVASCKINLVSDVKQLVPIHFRLGAGDHHASFRRFRFIHLHENTLTSIRAAKIDIDIDTCYKTLRYKVF